MTACNRLLASLTCAAAALILPHHACAASPAQIAPSLQVTQKIHPLPRTKTQGTNKLTAYLMAYFKDQDHALHFAVSKDGYSFTDVNDGKPVLSGHDIAEQHGIRDPYIMRGPDGAFYMAMTDLHINAKQEGLRETEWERPFADYGWGNNRSLIFMKSFDLLHWTHTIVHVDELAPSMKDIGVAWAPEVIYDDKAGKLMVYFTTRQRNETLHMVYAYTNSAFDRLETEPKPLFQYPKPKVASLDGDITRVGNKYHLFYAINEEPGQLRHAVSDHLTGGYVYDPKQIDPETVSTEAPTIWRRHGTDRYVLMYDVFGAKPVNAMGFSETTDFVHFRDLGHFNAPNSPMKATNFTQAKHGAVTAISPAEAQRLMAYFHPKPSRKAP